MRSIIMFIVCICFIDIIIVSGRPQLTMSRSYIRNLENLINTHCNLYAFNQTNNSDIYECIRYKRSNCHIHTNFTKYDFIKEKCIVSKYSECSSGILIGIIIWIVAGVVFVH